MTNKQELIECIEAEGKALRDSIEHAIILSGNNITDAIADGFRSLEDKLEEIADRTE